MSEDARRPFAPRPFERISGRTLVENAWHRYRCDRYVRADGSEGDYYHIDIAGSAVVVPVLEDGRVVLLRVRRYLLDTWLWEFPIGGIADGEDALDVARKELREESGYRAETWQKLGVFAPYKGVSNERCHVFLATGLEPGAQDLEPSEEIEVHTVEVDVARDLMLGGGGQAHGSEKVSLGDGQALAALAYYERARERAST